MDTRLVDVYHELDAHFAKYGLKMSRKGIRDTLTNELLHACTTPAEMTRHGLEEVEKRKAARRE